MEETHVYFFSKIIFIKRGKYWYFYNLADEKGKL